MPIVKVLAPQPRWRFLDDNGVPLAGAKVFLYEPGTTTKKTTYTDATGLTPNTNPIILDANGECDVWVDSLTPESMEAFPPGPPGPPGQPGPPGPPGATGNTAEFSHTVDINSETIYNSLFGGYIEIVPTPGTGIALVPVMMVVQFHYQTIPYTMNSANLAFYWGAPPLFPVLMPNSEKDASFMESISDKLVFLPPDPGINGETMEATDLADHSLTVSLDAAPTGPPIIATNVADGGSGYAVGDTGTVDGGTDLATYEIATVDGSGAVLTWVITDLGTGYSDGSSVTTTIGGAQPGVGSGLTFDVTSAETTSGSLRITTYYRKFTLM